MEPNQDEPVSTPPQEISLQRSPGETYTHLFIAGLLLMCFNLIFVPILFGVPPLSVRFIMGLALYGISITPEVDSHRGLIYLVMFACVFLIPLLILPVSYWVYRSKHVIQALALALVLSVTTLGFIVHEYCDECTHNYEAAKSLMGLEMAQDELFTRCGQPVFLKDYVPSVHWVYCNADAILPVYPLENGMVRVGDDIYPFLD